jgi:choline dehydrogenase-like flavoprotein
MSEEFDFIIVGGRFLFLCFELLSLDVDHNSPNTAGTAGCTLASFLAADHPRSRILILEAGIDTLSYDLPATDPLVAFKRPELDYGYSTVPQRHLGNRVIPYARGKGLGGSSISNFMFWTVGSADDYDRWAALVGDDAWSWERVKEGYKEVSLMNSDYF